MLRLVSGELEAEIGLDRGADVRWAAVEDGPAAVFILAAQDVVRAFLEALLSSGAEERVHQDVIGLESGVGFEFAAPVAVLVLLTEQPLARAVDGGGRTAGKVVNFSETELRSGRRGFRREFFHTYCVSCRAALDRADVNGRPYTNLVRRNAGRRCGGDRLNNLWRQTETNVLRHDLNLAHVVVALLGQKLDDFFNQAFGSGGACGQSDSVHAFQPLRLNVAATVDQVGTSAEVARDFNEAVGIRTVLRADDQEQLGFGSDVFDRDLAVLGG